jgi:hypothetical protein
VVWALRHTQGLDESSQAIPRPRFLRQGSPPVEVARLSRRKGKATLIRDALLELLQLLELLELLSYSVFASIFGFFSLPDNWPPFLT